MPSIDRLEEFVVVVDAGSISAAARELGLPRATLSRRLGGLETELGVRLLHRQTRRLALTHAGQLLLERARCVVEDAQAAWLAVGSLDDTPRGRLRVSMPPTSLFHDVLVSFARTHRQVQLEVAATPRHIDLFAEKVDVAMRFGPSTDSRLIVRKLWSDRTSLVASPEYLRHAGCPERVEQLGEHDCIVGFADGWRAANGWPLRQGGSITVEESLVSNEAPLRLCAALEGLGIALLPDPLTQAYRDSGQLRWVLEAEIGAVVGPSLVFPEREFMPPQVRAFIEYITAHYRDGMRLDRRLLPPVLPVSQSS